MKGKLINTRNFVAALLGNKAKKPVQPQRMLNTASLHALVWSKSRDIENGPEPTYRSISALIH